MKLVFLQENLERTLLLINKIVSLKTQLPITTNVLIKTGKNGIEFLGTDLENSIQVLTPGKIDEEGSIAIPIKTLTETVSILPKERVVLEEDNFSATIKSGRYKIKINGISPEEFPELPKVEKKEETPIKDALLNVKAIAIAAALDESRAVLTGVLTLFNQDIITLVATDGYRLSFKKISCSPKFKTTAISAILPARILVEVAKIVSEKEKEESQDGEKITLALVEEKNQAIFFIDNITIATRLIEGEFPNYEKIIPQGFTTKAVFDKEEFTKAVKLSSIFARESANIIKINITKNGLTLSANAPQVGENTCEVEARVEGDENNIAFNSRFLLDFLSAIDAKEIVFEMTGPLNPGVFKIPGDDSYLHIIMPVRVQG